MQILRKSLFMAGAALLSAAVPSLHAQVHIFDETTTLFTPSFRTGNDSNHTTWFGWASGTFDANLDNELVDNPPVTVGAGGSDGQINQTTAIDIMASSNNLYRPGPFYSGAPDSTTETINLTIPVNIDIADIGSGFTTIIIQGHSTSSPYGDTALDYFDFGSVAGVPPVSFVFGINANTSGHPEGQGQFWVKYEIAGSAPSYLIPFFLPKGTAIAGLQVDTLWSDEGFAGDSVAQSVPEPGSALLLAGGGLALMILRRRGNRS